MPKLVAAEIVVPKTLDRAARTELVDALFAIHCRVFDGVARDQFVDYVVDSGAEHTSIQLYRSERGELVGYFAAHVFERELAREKVAVFRGEVGILRAYRGGHVAVLFAADRILRYMARHPGRPLYFLGSLVHPSSYAQIARCADRVWPNPEVETPADIAALMDQLGDVFGLERADETNALVREVGWVTRDSAADREHWQASHEASVRFFLQQNPRYTEGLGLLTLVPTSAAGVLRAAGRCAGRRAKKHVESTAAIARQALGALWSPPADTAETT